MSGFLQNLKWRKQHKIDGIRDEDWSDFVLDYPYTNDTFDFAGRPSKRKLAINDSNPTFTSLSHVMFTYLVGAFSISDWDFRRASTSGNQMRLFRYMTKLLEEATVSVIKLQSEGKNVTQWKVLMNMDGFNLIQHACGSCKMNLGCLTTSIKERSGQASVFRLAFDLFSCTTNIKILCAETGLPGFTNFVQTYENYYPAFADAIVIINSM